MGNWKNVADYIGTGKTHKQIEEHYFELYMGVHGYCLPSKTITADGAVDTLSLCPNSGAVDTFDGSSSTAGADRVNGANPFNVDVNSDLSDYYRINTNEGYHPGELVQRDIGKDTSTIKGKDNRAEYQSRLSALPGSDLPGYIPLRGDFDIEYDNNAEHLLADMEFNVDDHPSEKSLKLQIVEIFNQKLAERDERKRFVIERGLVDIRQTQAVSFTFIFSLENLRLYVFRYHVVECHRWKSAGQRTSESYLAS